MSWCAQCSKKTANKSRIFEKRSKYLLIALLNKRLCNLHKIFKNSRFAHNLFATVIYFKKMLKVKNMSKFEVIHEPAVEFIVQNLKKIGVVN